MKPQRSGSQQQQAVRQAKNQTVAKRHPGPMYRSVPCDGFPSAQKGLASVAARRTFAGPVVAQ